MAAGLEREIKLRFDDADTARRAIRAAGGELAAAKRRQHDCLVDWPDRRLAAQRTALRVRVEPTRGWITYKGPVQDSMMKLREEIESEIGDAPAVLLLLQRLGLEVWFRYEKDREEYACDGTLVALDDTPIGTYVEIEGEEAAIVRVAERLGRGPADYVRDSYFRLFQQYCERQGIAAAHMLFDTVAPR